MRTGCLPVARRTHSVHRACTFCLNLQRTKTCTWWKALWTTISVLREERLSEALARINGGFWEPSEKGEEGEAGEEEEDTWRVDIKQELQAQEGPDANDPFYISLLRITLVSQTHYSTSSHLGSGTERTTADQPSGYFLLVCPGSQILMVLMEYGW